MIIDNAKSLETRVFIGKMKEICLFILFFSLKIKKKQKKLVCFTKKLYLCSGNCCEMACRMVLWHPLCAYKPPSTASKTGPKKAGQCDNKLCVFLYLLIYLIFVIMNRKRIKNYVTPAQETVAAGGEVPGT